MPGFRPPGFGDPKPDQEIKPYNLDNAQAKAVAVLKKNAILEGDFADLYGSDNIEADLSYVYAKKQRYAASNKEKGLVEVEKLATVLEAVIYSQINSSQWFGPHAKAFKASDYDDFEHGVDGIVEIKPPQFSANYLGLGIDVTFSSKHLGANFERIKEEIDNGKLATIKYLKTLDYRGERNNIPRLIITVDGETVSNLAKSWYDNAPGLKDSIIRYQILKEIMEQLVVFESYARKVGQDSVAQKYAETKAVIEPIYIAIEKQFANYKQNLTDKAYSALKEQLEMFI